jgi:hypothetical protein
MTEQTFIKIAMMTLPCQADDTMHSLNIYAAALDFACIRAVQFADP